MCCHLGFVVPFIEHKQSRFSITLKGPQLFEMENEYWHHLPSLAPNKRISLSFEALKPAIDFLLVMKVLDSIFFQQKPILSMLKIFLVQPLSLIQLYLLDNLLQLLNQRLLLHFSLVIQSFFFLNIMNQPLLASHFSSATSSTSLSLRKIEENQTLALDKALA